MAVAAAGDEQVWHGRGWIDLRQDLFVPRKTTPCSYLVKVPVNVPDQAHELALTGRRLDVAGSWDGHQFTVSSAAFAQNQEEPSYVGTPPHPGESMSWAEGRALESSRPPEAMERLLGASAMPAIRENPSHGATHLSLEVTYVDRELEDWRAAHPLGRFVLFRATIGQTGRWLFD
ncbi:hypothetical protein [Enemella evansiae]|uniref:hypothetical protein n=1 Tax=Enemella evansiae TaxID=2016499 RepID=UPI00105C5FBC|nr:hypothetical protein [Enemella evansiae]TDO93546.1 hypothetical protein C8D81_1333 [Enemella evansiae]